VCDAGASQIPADLHMLRHRCHPLVPFLPAASMNCMSCNTECIPALLHRHWLSLVGPRTAAPPPPPPTPTPSMPTHHLTHHMPPNVRRACRCTSSICLTTMQAPCWPCGMQALCQCATSGVLQLTMNRPNIVATACSCWLLAAGHSHDEAVTTKLLYALLASARALVHQLLLLSCDRPGPKPCTRAKPYMEQSACRW
jgi:hypothetical protein